MEKLFLKYKNLIYQLGRFGGIGLLNTAVDFSIFNILIASTGITEGFQLSLLKVVAFVVAVMHSFLWNKYWTFGSIDEKFLRFFVRLAAVGCLGALVVLADLYGSSQQFLMLYFALVILGLFVCEVVVWKIFNLKLQTSGKEEQQLGLFLTVSIIGAIINAAIVGLITHYIPPAFGVNARLWANMANILAILIAMVWNFIGYKLFVFKK